jgi:hypothetical protein
MSVTVRRLFVRVVAPIVLLAALGARIAAASPALTAQEPQANGR